MGQLENGLITSLSLFKHIEKCKNNYLDKQKFKILVSGINHITYKVIWSLFIMIRREK